MSERPASARTRSAGPRTAAILAAASLGACSGNGAKGPGATLTPEDFQRPSAGAPAPTAPPPPDTAAAPPAAPPRPLKPIRMIAVSEAMQGVLDVSTVPGPPATDGTPPAETAEPAIVLDSKVGEINGRPIFASAFLEPLDGRLRATAEEAAGDPKKWVTLAKPVISDALQREIIDELLLAEAHAAIPREARDVGLRAFMQQFRADLARQNQGSTAAADERLRREEGLSIDEKTRQALDRELIRTHLWSRIVPRIQVSARDQRDYYERYFSDFNPPGEARLRLIRVSAADETAVAAVRGALEAGTPFAEVAALEANRYKRDDAGLHTVAVEGKYEEATLFGIPELNDAARGLEQGRHAGPIALGESVWWVMLEGVDRPDATSFYDAQLEINRLLMSERSAIEENRYLQLLKSKGSFSDLNQTAQRLFDIATARYFAR